MYEIPDNFFQILDDKYNLALDGHIFFSGDGSKNDRVEETYGSTKLPYQLTLLKSLTKRPEKGNVASNPFLKSEPELTVLESFGPNDEFKVIFNKFPVVPRHFMLVTREYKSQNTPLSLNELVATYSILKKVSSEGEEKWFAFYNCGPESGASQPHKHIQFMNLPKDFVPFTETLAKGSEPFIPNLKKEPLQNIDLPFAHFVAPLPHDLSNTDEEELSMYFVSLLQRVLNVLKDNQAEHISYNVLMTTDYMALIPRSVGKFQDKIGINSCGFMGLILCKDQDLLDVVYKEGATNILQSCGFPNIKGQSSDEYHY